MINRIFTNPKSNLAVLNTDHSFSFSRKQQLATFVKLDEQMLKFEKRYLCRTPASHASSTIEPCTYDEFGLLAGVELDVSWM